MFLGYVPCARGKFVLPPVARRPRRFGTRLRARRSNDCRCRRVGAFSEREARSRVRRRADGGGGHAHRQHPLDPNHRPRRHACDVARSRPPRRGNRLGTGSMARCPRRGDRPPSPPPSFSSSCPSRSTPETPAPWTRPRSRQAAPALAVQTTADGARAYVAERGYRLRPALSSRITALYASRMRTSSRSRCRRRGPSCRRAPLRVSDDGGAILPLTLSGGSSTRLTVFAIGAGVAAVPGTQDIDRRALRWGPEGSTFATWRSDLIKAGNGATWLRESASHDAIFENTPVAGGSPTSSVVTGYFSGTACTSAAARSVSSNDGVVGTSCAPGAAARVQGPDGSCVRAHERRRRIRGALLHGGYRPRARVLRPRPGQRGRDAPRRVGSGGRARYEPRHRIPSRGEAQFAGDSRGDVRRMCAIAEQRLLARRALEPSWARAEQRRCGPRRRTRSTSRRAMAAAEARSARAPRTYEKKHHLRWTTRPRRRAAAVTGPPPAGTIAMTATAGMTATPETLAPATTRPRRLRRTRAPAVRRAPPAEEATMAGTPKTR